MNKISSSYIFGGITVLLLAFLVPYILGLTFNKKHPPSPNEQSLPSFLEKIQSNSVDWNNADKTFPQGVYYEYTGNAPAEEVASTRRIKHPEVIFGFLAGKGVNLSEAWFKSYASSCSPPGSNKAMDVIVPAKLIIRVASPIDQSRLKNLGLKKRSSPSMGTCAYQIRHYTFSSK